MPHVRLLEPGDTFAIRRPLVNAPIFFKNQYWDNKGFSMIHKNDFDTTGMRSRWFVNYYALAESGNTIYLKLVDYESSVDIQGTYVEITDDYPQLIRIEFTEYVEQNIHDNRTTVILKICVWWHNSIQRYRAGF